MTEGATPPLPDPPALPNDRRVRVAILISGRGSNMKALADAAGDPDCPFQIAGVISNRPQAPGLDLARSLGLATRVVDHSSFPDRAGFEQAVDAAMADWAPDLVCLAGFMRKLTPWLVTRWWGRMLNVHPSLLPAYRGLDTHARAIADGVQVSGCTVHLVSPDLDAGPILAQAIVPVLPDDRPEDLAARILTVEHPLYVGAVWALAGGAVRLRDGRVTGPGPRLLLHPHLTNPPAADA